MAHRQRVESTCSALVTTFRRNRERNVHMSWAAGLKFQCPYGSRAINVIITPCRFESVPTMALLTERPGDRRHGLGRLRPASVEAQVSQGLGNLTASQTALETAAQVNIELVVVAHRGKCGDGDQAAIPHA